MTERQWSAYQRDIFDAVLGTDDNLIIQAAAGSGKSTTLFEAIRRYSRVHADRRLMFMSFNAEIKKHAEKHLKGVNSCQVYTFHGYGNYLMGCSGFGQKWGAAMDTSKVFKSIFQAHIDWPGDRKGRLLRMVSQMRTVGLMTYDELLIREFIGDNWQEVFGYPDATLRRLFMSKAGVVARLLRELDEDKLLYDFDDMCRFPLLYDLLSPKALPQNRVPQVLLVDECFPYWTPVLVDVGKWVPIGEIVADPGRYPYVLSYDLASRTTVRRRVTSVKAAKSSALLRIEVRCGDAVGSIQCTPDHKLHVVGHGTVRARDVVVGHTMVADRSYGVVTRVEETALAREIDVYDINVDGTHLFWTAAVSEDASARLHAEPAEPLFPLLVHNCQDLNEYQFQFIEKLMQRGSRIISCGDRWQAIYGFRGADMYSMTRLKKLTRSVELPLSITYRCKSNIVKFVKSRVPGQDVGIEAFQEGGKVILKDTSKASSDDPTALYDLERLLSSGTQMVVSPKNKHLLVIWIALFQKGIPASLKGSKITNSLSQMLKNFCSDGVPLSEVPQRCREVADSERADPKARDLASTCVEFLVRLGIKSYNQAQAKLSEIAKNDTGIKLHTIHSSKGLESEKIWFINDLFDSDQTVNMTYVGLTRASDRLYYVVNDAWGQQRKRPPAARAPAPEDEDEDENDDLAAWRQRKLMGKGHGR